MSKSCAFFNGGTGKEAFLLTFAPMMIEGPITFDRLARWGLAAGGVVLALCVVNYLSAVLLPFFVAWLFAYLLYPIVKFIQYRLRVRMRAVSIVLAMVFCLALIGGVLWLIIPPMVEQFGKFTSMGVQYLHGATHIADFPQALRWCVMEYHSEIEEFLASESFTGALKEAMPRLFNVLGESLAVVWSIAASCITLLYMFFILLDYEYLSEKWVTVFPRSARPFWRSLMNDVEAALNNYIRGQGLIAFTMGVLFCIGFTIIDLPMAIGLGVLIGILDMVPYLHTFALIPAAFLAAMKAAETGQNYWVVLAMTVAVFAVVQVIIDAVVTPRIMGKRMGLNPAVLLLSLSVWGALLGFIGLIIALPATTIIIAYWKRYVTKEDPAAPPAA